VNCINVADKDYWDCRNIRFTGATGDNVTGSVNVPRYWRFINCEFDNAGLDGVGDSGGKYLSTSQFVHSLFHSNAGSGVGFYMLYSHFALCSFYDNGTSGVVCQNSSLSHCLSYRNGSHNIHSYGNNSIIGCVSDSPIASGGCVYSIGASDIVLGCRLTGGLRGFYGDYTGEVLDLYNFINTTNKADNVVVDQQIRGTDTRTETGVEGYIDAAGGNYGLTNQASARRQEVTL
jgi:hypothetical protein